jgi:hypothetical protein
MTRARNLSKLSNPAVFTVDTDNNVGVNSTVPKEKLNVVGVVSATSFFGDGTGLTGVANTAIINSQQVNVSGVVTASSFVGNGANLTALNGTAIASGTVAAARVATLNQNTTGTAGGLSGTPDITVRNITGVAATFTGVLNYEDVTNVDSVGIVTARGGFEIGASGVGGTITAAGSAEFAGIVTATSFSGSGANLTNLPAGGDSLDITASLFI